MTKATLDSPATVPAPGLDSVRAAVDDAESYGRPERPAPRSVLLEYVSADPIGPLTLDHARGALLGDSLSRLLGWCGSTVRRESYVNDMGPALERLGRSVEARYRQAAGEPNVRFPEDGFPDGFIGAVARDILAIRGRSLLNLPAEELAAASRGLGRDLVITRHNRSLERLGVELDEWFSEAELHTGGAVDSVIDRLGARAAVYEEDSAVWLRSSQWGDAEDRLLRRSSGQATYLAADLAYHGRKAEMGHDLLVDIWPAHHASYVDRTLAACRALGQPTEKLRIVLFQPVQPRIDGMSLGSLAGQGNNLTLDEVLEEVGAATLRLVLLLAPVDQPAEIDLNRVRRPGADNPAWVVYRALSEGAGFMDRLEPAGSEAPLTELRHPAELDLIRRVDLFPNCVEEAVDQLDPVRIARALVQTAESLLQFVRDCGRGSGALDPPRRILAEAAMTVIRRASALLGLPHETDARIRLDRGSTI